MALKNVGSYIKNLGKSVKYAAQDEFEARMPSAYEFVNTNQEIFKATYDSIKNYRNTVLRINKFVKGSKVYEAANVGINAVFEDLRTGNFYNKERSMNSALSAMGASDMGEEDFDFNFDDVDFSADDPGSGPKVKSGSSESKTPAIQSATREGAELISDTIARTTQVSMDNNRATASLMLQHTTGLLTNIHSGIHTMSGVINNGINGMSEQFNTYANNSKVFYETITKDTQEIKGILTEMLEMERNRYAEEQEREKKGKSTFGDITGANGMPDLKEYFNRIKANAKGASGMAGQLIDLLGSFEGNALAQLVSSPLQFIPETIVKAAVPAAVGFAAEELDKTLSTVFANFVGKFNELASDDSGRPIDKAIGKLFGIKNSLITGIKPKQLEGKAVPFDDVVRESIVTEIPTYLRKILSYISGEEEMIYNRDKGTFTTGSALQKEFDSVQESQIASAFSDFNDEMNKMLKYIQFENKTQADNFDKFVKRIQASQFNKGYAANINDMDFDKAAEKLGLSISDEINYALYQSIFRNIDKNTIMNLAGNILSGRDSHNSRMKNFEKNSVYAALFNNSNPEEFIVKDKFGQNITKNIKGLSNANGKYMGGPLGFDSLGHDVFFYLQKMYSELTYIRQEGIPTIVRNDVTFTGGGRKRKKKNRGNGNYPEPARPIITQQQTPWDTRGAFSDHIEKNKDNLSVTKKEERRRREENDRYRERAKKNLAEGKDYIYLEGLEMGDYKNLAAAVTGRVEPALAFRKGVKNKDKNQRFEDYKQQRYSGLSGSIIKEIEDIKLEREKQAKADDFNYINNKKELQTKEEIENEKKDKKNLLEAAADIVKRPSKWVEDVLNATNARIYDLFFGKTQKIDERTGKPITGLGERIAYEFRQTWENVKETFQEKIIDPLREKLGLDEDETLLHGILRKMGLEDAVYGENGLWTQTKEQLRGVGQWVMDQLQGTYVDVKKALGYEDKKKDQEETTVEQDTTKIDELHKDMSDISNQYSESNTALVTAIQNFAKENQDVYEKMVDRAFTDKGIDDKFNQTKDKIKNTASKKDANGKTYLEKYGINPMAAIEEIIEDLRSVMPDEADKQDIENFIKEYDEITAKYNENQKTRKLLKDINLNRERSIQFTDEEKGKLSTLERIYADKGSLNEEQKKEIERLRQLQLGSANYKAAEALLSSRGANDVYLYNTKDLSKRMDRFTQNKKYDAEYKRLKQEHPEMSDKDLKEQARKNSFIDIGSSMSRINQLTKDVSKMQQELNLYKNGGEETYYDLSGRQQTRKVEPLSAEDFAKELARLTEAMEKNNKEISEILGSSAQVALGYRESRRADYDAKKEELKKEQERLKEEKKIAERLNLLRQYGGANFQEIIIAQQHIKELAEDYGVKVNDDSFDTAESTKSVINKIQSQISDQRRRANLNNDKKKAEEIKKQKEELNKNNTALAQWGQVFNTSYEGLQQGNKVEVEGKSQQVDLSDFLGKLGLWNTLGLNDTESVDNSAVRKGLSSFISDSIHGSGGFSVKRMRDLELFNKDPKSKKLSIADLFTKDNDKYEAARKHGIETDIFDKAADALHDLMNKSDENVESHAKGGITGSSVFAALSKGEDVEGVTVPKTGVYKVPVGLRVNSNGKGDPRGERQAKRKFIDSIFDSIKGYADGGSVGLDGETSLDDILAEAQAAEDAANSDVQITEKYKAKVNPDDTLVGQTIDTAKQGIDAVFNSLFDPGDDEKLKDAANDVFKNIRKYAPAALAGTIVGGGIGLLVGGPLLAASAGAAVGIAKNSDKVKDWLFGELDDNNERTGGIVSKDVQQTIKKYVPDISKYGVTGAIAGLLTPFGPVGGLMIGSAVAWAKNNDEVREALFGDEDGLLSKKRREAIKKAFPNIAVGTIGMLVAGPFGGLLPNAVLGTGLGLLSTTDGFKDAIFGEEDENGERHGGVLGAVKDYVVDPLKEFATGFKDKVADFIIEEMINPVKEAIVPIAKRLSVMSKSIFTFGGKAIGWVMDKAIASPVGAFVKDKILDPATSLIKGLFNIAIKPAKLALSAPSKIIGAIGDRARNWGINTGNADYMTAEERMAYRAEHPNRKRFGGLFGLKDQDKYELFDSLLAETTDIKELEELKKNVDMSNINMGTVRKKQHKLKNDIYTTVDQFFSDKQKDNIPFVFTKANRRKLVGLLQDGKSGDAIKLLTKLRGKNGAKLDRDEVMELVDQFKDQSDVLRNLNLSRSTWGKQEKDARARLKALGLGDVKGEYKTRISKYLETEIKDRKSRNRGINPTEGLTTGAFSEIAHEETNRLIDAFASMGRQAEKFMEAVTTNTLYETGNKIYDDKNKKIVNKAHKKNEKAEGHIVDQFNTLEGQTKALLRAHGFTDEDFRKLDLNALTDEQFLNEIRPYIKNGTLDYNKDLLVALFSKQSKVIRKSKRNVKRLTDLISADRNINFGDASNLIFGEQDDKKFSQYLGALHGGMSLYSSGINQKIRDKYKEETGLEARGREYSKYYQQQLAKEDYDLNKLKLYGSKAYAGFGDRYYDSGSDEYGTTSLTRKIIGAPFKATGKAIAGTAHAISNANRESSRGYKIDKGTFLSDKKNGSFINSMLNAGLITEGVLKKTNVFRLQQFTDHKKEINKIIKKINKGEITSEEGIKLLKTYKYANGGITGFDYDDDVNFDYNEKESDKNLEQFKQALLSEIDEYAEGGEITDTSDPTDEINKEKEENEKKRLESKDNSSDSSDNNKDKNKNQSKTFIQTVFDSMGRPRQWLVTKFSDPQKPNKIVPSTDSATNDTVSEQEKERGIFKTAFDAVKDKVGGVFEWLKSSILPDEDESKWSVLKKWLGRVFLGTSALGALPLIKKGLDKLYEATTTRFLPALETFWGNSVKPWFAEHLGGTFEKIKPWWEETIMPKFDAFFNTVSNIYHTAKDTIFDIPRVATTFFFDTLIPWFTGDKSYTGRLPSFPKFITDYFIPYEVGGISFLLRDVIPAFGKVFMQTLPSIVRAGFQGFRNLMSIDLDNLYGSKSERKSSMAEQYAKTAEEKNSKSLFANYGKYQKHYEQFFGTEDSDNSKFIGKDDNDVLDGITISPSGETVTNTTTTKEVVNDDSGGSGSSSGSSGDSNDEDEEETEQTIWDTLTPEEAEQKLIDDYTEKQYYQTSHDTLGKHVGKAFIKQLLTGGKWGSSGHAWLSNILKRHKVTKPLGYALDIEKRVAELPSKISARAKNYFGSFTNVEDELADGITEALEGSADDIAEELAEGSADDIAESIIKDGIVDPTKFGAEGKAAGFGNSDDVAKQLSEKLKKAQQEASKKTLTYQELSNGIETLDKNAWDDLLTKYEKETGSDAAEDIIKELTEQRKTKLGSKITEQYLYNTPGMTDEAYLNYMNNLKDKYGDEVVEMLKSKGYSDALTTYSDDTVEAVTRAAIEKSSGGRLGKNAIDSMVTGGVITTEGLVDATKLGAEGKAAGFVNTTVEQAGDAIKEKYGEEAAEKLFAQGVDDVISSASDSTSKKFLTNIKKTFTNIFGGEKFYDLVKKEFGEEAAEGISKELQGNFLSKLLVEISKRLPQAAQSTMLKISAAAATFGTSQILIALAEFLNGFASAETIMSIVDPPFLYRILCGVYKALKESFFLTSLIPDETVFSLLESVLSACDLGENFVNAREATRLATEQYNIANGYAHYEYEMDENGNILKDEDGNPIITNYVVDNVNRALTVADYTVKNGSAWVKFKAWTANTVGKAIGKLLNMSALPYYFTNDTSLYIVVDPDTSKIRCFASSTNAEVPNFHIVDFLLDGGLINESDEDTWRKMPQEDMIGELYARGLIIPGDEEINVSELGETTVTNDGITENKSSKIDHEMHFNYNTMEYGTETEGVKFTSTTEEGYNKVDQYQRQLLEQGASSNSDEINRLVALKNSIKNREFNYENFKDLPVEELINQWEYMGYNGQLRITHTNGNEYGSLQYFSKWVSDNHYDEKKNPDGTLKGDEYKSWTDYFTALENNSLKSGTSYDEYMMSSPGVYNVDTTSAEFAQQVQYAWSSGSVGLTGNESEKTGKSDSETGIDTGLLADISAQEKAKIRLEQLAHAQNLSYSQYCLKNGINPRTGEYMYSGTNNGLDDDPNLPGGDRGEYYMDNFALQMDGNVPDITKVAGYSNKDTIYGVSTARWDLLSEGEQEAIRLAYIAKNGETKDAIQYDALYTGTDDFNLEGLDPDSVEYAQAYNAYIDSVYEKVANAKTKNGMEVKNEDGSVKDITQILEELNESTDKKYTKESITQYAESLNMEYDKFMENYAEALKLAGLDLSQYNTEGRYMGDYIKEVDAGVDGTATGECYITPTGDEIYVKNDDGTYTSYSASGTKLNEGIAAEDMPSYVRQLGLIQCTLSDVDSAISNNEVLSANAISTWQDTVQFISDMNAETNSAYEDIRNNQIRTTLKSVADSSKSSSNTFYTTDTDYKPNDGEHSEGTGKNYTPNMYGKGSVDEVKNAANMAVKNGYKEKDGGTKPGFFKKLFNNNGIDSELSQNKNTIESNIRDGNPTVLMGTNKTKRPKSPYGTYPHYVLATKADGNNVEIQDPEDNRSNVNYKMDDVLNDTTLAVSAKGKYGRGPISAIKNFISGNKGESSSGDSGSKGSLASILGDKLSQITSYNGILSSIASTWTTYKTVIASKWQSIQEQSESLLNSAGIKNIFGDKSQDVWYDYEGNYYAPNGDGTFNYYTANNDLLSKNISQDDIDFSGLVQGTIDTSRSGKLKELLSGRWDDIQTAWNEVKDKAAKTWEYVKDKATTWWKRLTGQLDSDEEVKSNIGDYYIDANGVVYGKDSGNTYTSYNANGSKLKTYDADAFIELVQKQSLVECDSATFNSAKSRESTVKSKAKDVLTKNQDDTDDTLDENDKGEGKYGTYKEKIKKALHGTGRRRYSYGTGNDDYIKQTSYDGIRYNAPGDTTVQTIGDSGCGIISGLNAVKAYNHNMYGTGSSVDEVKNATNMAVKNGYKEKDGGTKPGFFKKLFNNNGIDSELNRDRSSIESNIRAGNPTVLMGSNDSSMLSPYGNAGNPHYVLATKADGNNVEIQDPQDNRSNVKYNMNDVLRKTSFGVSAKGKYGRGNTADYVVPSNRIVGYSADNSSVNLLKAAKNQKNNIEKVIDQYKKHPDIVSRSLYNPQGAQDDRIAGMGLGKFASYMYGTGDAEAKEVWGVLKGLGYSDEAAAAVIGNLYAESGVDPTRYQDGGGIGRGLAQWSVGGRFETLKSYAESRGKDWTDLETQVLFLNKEFTDSAMQTYFDANAQYTSSSDDFINSTIDPEKLAVDFEEVFERAGTPRLDVRKTYAKKYYDQYKGTSGDGSSSKYSSRSLPIRKEKVLYNCDDRVGEIYLPSHVVGDVMYCEQWQGIGGSSAPYSGSWQAGLKNKLGIKSDSELPFDSETGIGLIDDKFYTGVFAPAIGRSGDYIDVTYDNGLMFHFIQADSKGGDSEHDGANWDGGDYWVDPNASVDTNYASAKNPNGTSITDSTTNNLIEFAVDAYDIAACNKGGSKPQPGTTGNHPEWSGHKVKKVENLGSYVDGDDYDVDSPFEYVTSSGKKRVITKLKLSDLDIDKTSYRQTNHPGSKDSTPKSHVVVHYTVSSTAASAANSLNDGRGLSTHYIVGLDGQIYEYENPDNYTSTCGSLNSGAINIEGCNYYGPSDAPSNDKIGWWSDEGYESIKKLSAALCNEYNLDPLNGGLLRHYDDNDPNSECYHKCCPAQFSPHNAMKTVQGSESAVDNENWEEDWETFKNEVSDAMVTYSEGDDEDDGTSTKEVKNPSLFDKVSDVLMGPLNTINDEATEVGNELTKAIINDTFGDELLSELGLSTTYSTVTVDANGNEVTDDNSDLIPDGTKDAKQNWAYYNQGDSRWGSKEYNNSTYANAGCGPTAMSMILTGLIGKKYLPTELPAKYGNKVGTASWEGITTAAEDYGLSVEDWTPSDLEKYKKAIDSNRPVLISGTNTSEAVGVSTNPFTTGGHFVISHGYIADGDTIKGVIINDPGGRSGVYENLESLKRGYTTNGHMWSFKVSDKSKAPTPASGDEDFPVVPTIKGAWPTKKSSSGSADTKVEKYVQLMEEKAADDRYGYEWGNWGPYDYDCSSFVISNVEEAGIPVKSKGGATYTKNMVEGFTKCGFEDVTSSTNTTTGDGIIRGDIVLNSQEHAACSVGDGKLVNASSNYDGVSGDSSGKEVWVTNFYPDNWDYILRYKGDNSVSSSSSSSSSSSDDDDTYSSDIDYDKASMLSTNLGTGKSSTTNPIRWFNNLKGFKGLTSKFGKRTRNGLAELHNGIDFDVDENSNVRSPISGVISGVYNPEDSDGYGNMVVLRDKYGMYHWFAHMNASGVEEGDSIQTGDILGLSGDTGDSDAPHLHYTISTDDADSLDNTIIDPSTYDYTTGKYDRSKEMSTAINELGETNDFSFKFNDDDSSEEDRDINMKAVGGGHFGTARATGANTKRTTTSDSTSGAASSFVSILNNIVTILQSIATNTSKLDTLETIVELLSEQFDIAIKNENLTAGQATKLNKLKQKLKEIQGKAATTNQGSSTGFGNSLMNSDMEYLMTVMSGIAVE